MELKNEKYSIIISEEEFELFQAYKKEKFIFQDILIEKEHDYMQNTFHYQKKYEEYDRKIKHLRGLLFQISKMSLWEFIKHKKDTRKLWADEEGFCG